MPSSTNMADYVIRDLTTKDEIPYSLLLQADPWKEQVDNYVKEGLCRIALLDSRCIGVYVLKLLDSQAEIMNIAVDSELRGKGFGKKLILDAKDQCRKRGFKTLWVGTGNSSFSELAFYQKCGFRIVSVDLDYFADYPEKIVENGIWCRDLIKMSMDL